MNRDLTGYDLIDQLFEHAVSLGYRVQVIAYDSTGSRAVSKVAFLSKHLSEELHEGIPSYVIEFFITRDNYGWEHKGICTYTGYELGYDSISIEKTDWDISKEPDDFDSDDLMVAKSMLERLLVILNSRIQKDHEDELGMALL